MAVNLLVAFAHMLVVWLVNVGSSALRLFTDTRALFHNILDPYAL